MGSIPQQVAQSEKHKLTPVFGVEMYVNAMQPMSESREKTAEFRASLNEVDQKKFGKSHHLLAIAYSDVGYSNLVQLTSWGWKHGFYKKPRVNHEVLKQHKEGIIFTSSCASSEIAHAFFDDGEDAGLAMLEKYMAMFGEDFYLELMMLDFKLQKPYDAFLLRAHDKYHIPLILTTDCHYCRKEHSKYQRLMLMQQTGTTIPQVNALIAAGKADDVFTLQDQNLWMKSEDELNQKWESDYQDIIDYELYKQAKSNTVAICEKASNVKLDKTIKLPQFNSQDESLMDDIIKGRIERAIPNNSIYDARIKEEYELICEKGFASYFIIQKMMLDEARKKCPEILGYGDGSEAVGPGRGSVCGSLVAYCLRLHDVEPIEHDLLFSRFLSPVRGGKQMKTRFTIDPLGNEHEVE
jgi:DNA polymerase-3 subunit alpha